MTLQDVMKSRYVKMNSRGRICFEKSNNILATLEAEITPRKDSSQFEQS